MDDTSDLRATRLLRWALILGLFLRIVVLTQTGTLGTGIVDEQHYRALATNLLDRHEYAVDAGNPTSIRPPLFPWFVAGTWLVAGSHSLQAVRAGQIVLSLLTSMLAYALGRRAFGHSTACYGAAIAWLYPSLVLFNFLILTETLFTLLLIAFLWLTVWLVQSGRADVALAAGIALGLGALTRSVLWPLPLLLCPLLLMLLTGSWSRRVMASGALLAGYLVVITPWAIRNTRLQEVPTIVDTMSGINLRMGNYEFTPEDRMWDAVSIGGERSWVHGFSTPEGVAPTEGRKDKWAQAKAVEYMREHPGQTVRRFAIKFADLWGLEREFIAGVQEGLFRPPTWFAIAATAAIVIAYAALACLGAAGLWMAPPADWRVQVVLCLPIALIVLAHTVVFGHSRYHVPLMPILGLYAAQLVAQRWPLAWRQASGRPVAWLGATATVALLAAIWVRQILVVDSARLGALLQRVTG